MTHTHLLEGDAVKGALDAVVVLTTRKPVPHGFDICINFRCGPIRVAIVCYNTTQVLEYVIFVLGGGFEPVFRIEIHHNSTLVKTALAFEVRLHHKGEKLLVRLHLQHWCVVVAEVIVGALPQVGVWVCDNLYFVSCYVVTFGLTNPFEIVDVKIHIYTTLGTFIEIAVY